MFTLYTFDPENLAAGYCFKSVHETEKQAHEAAVGKSYRIEQTTPTGSMIVFETAL